jgi:hypothetical protein
MVFDGGVVHLGEEAVGWAGRVLGPLLPHLSERDKRLAAGAVARELGHGGIKAVAEATGLSQATVSDGMHELVEGSVAAGRVRRPGAGRKPAAEKDPGLVPALLALVEPTRRGDPMGPLAWTTLSLRDLAGQLAAGGHRVDPTVAGRLLREQGFSLRGNAKVLEGAQHPDRDAQFRHINDTAAAFLAAGDPVASIDAKKKEKVGNFANPGATWHPADQPVKVRDHDFLDPELGIATPFGIYDVGANTGWVNVGTDHNTAAFAVESIRRWWNHTGRSQYPNARRLLLTADAGGANAANSRLFKADLHAFAVEAGLEITVCHFPPGTSKWNKIEHRLFSAITHQWRGRPLTSHQVILDTIAATTTSTGLRVHAELDTNTYPLGREISKAQFAALPITPGRWHGDWNYTVRPESAAAPPPPRPHRPDTSWLLDRQVTGMDDDAWAAAVRYLQPAPRPPGARGPQPGTASLLTTQDKLLATVLNRRHRLPQHAVAALFGVSRETIKAAVPATIRALDRLGLTLTPAEQPLRTADRLAAALAAATPTHASP